MGGIPDLGSAGKIQLKVPESVELPRYSNVIQIASNGSEFFLDFINVCQPQALMVARIVITPSNFERMVEALNNNLEQYKQNLLKGDNK